MKNIIKQSVILIFLAVLTMSFLGCGNKEDIIDLDNGWKSYHNKKIGLTVKIPSDAEFKVSRDWETNVVGTSFSKGPIGSIGTWQLYYGDINKTYEDRVNEYREKISEKNNKWEYHAVGQKKEQVKQRTIYREIKIKEKTIFVEFIEVEYNDERENKFLMKALRIPIDENRFCYVRFGSYSADRLHETYPYLLEGDIEIRTDAYIEVIKDLIISIDD